MKKILQLILSILLSVLVFAFIANHYLRSSVIYHATSAGDLLINAYDILAQQKPLNQYLPQVEACADVSPPLEIFDLTEKKFKKITGNIFFGSTIKSPLTEVTIRCGKPEIAVTISGDSIIKIQRNFTSTLNLELLSGSITVHLENEKIKTILKTAYGDFHLSSTNIAIVSLQKSLTLGYLLENKLGDTNIIFKPSGNKLSLPLRAGAVFGKIKLANVFKDSQIFSVDGKNSLRIDSLGSIVSEKKP